jgi:hypothetical protein
LIREELARDVTRDQVSWSALGDDLGQSASIPTAATASTARCHA